VRFRADDCFRAARRNASASRQNCPSCRSDEHRRALPISADRVALKAGDGRILAVHVVTQLSARDRLAHRGRRQEETVSLRRSSRLVDLSADQLILPARYRLILDRFLPQHTVSLPTPAMREAIARAELGDDVYGEDPTVNQLERKRGGAMAKAAAMLGPEPARWAI